MAKLWKNQTKTIGWPQAIRDIVVASINKGQLPILGIIAVMLVVLWRIPPQDLSKLVDKLFELTAKHQILAYALNVILIIGWYIHSRFLRKMFSTEMERIGNEKSVLQNIVAGREFKSSDA